jgi:hypothetical protein
MSKFMLSLDKEVFGELERLAKERGIAVQELLRAVVIPEWIRAAGVQRKVHPPHSSARTLPTSSRRGG